MLLKKTLNRFVLKKNPKKNDKPANALPLGRKGRLGFSVYAAAVQMCIRDSYNIVQICPLH